MLFKITVLGDGGVGKTALTVQVSLSLSHLKHTRLVWADEKVYHVFIRGDIRPDN